MQSLSDVVDYAVEEYMNYIENYEYEVPFHTPLWDFTWAVRSCYSPDADPGRVFEAVEPEVRRRGSWSMFRDPNGYTLTREEAYLEFLYNWKKMRWAFGPGPFELAVKRAAANPLSVEIGHNGPPMPLYERFVSIAGWLQVLMEDAPIMLPCLKMGDLLDVSPMTITRMRKRAISEGLLSKTAEHSYSQGRATEFRFEIGQFPILAEAKEAGSSTPTSQDASAVP